MRKRLMELRQRADSLRKEATALLDAADTEDRDLTEDEETRYGEIEVELKALAASIRAEERNAERRSLLGTTAAAVVASVPAVASPDGPDMAATGGFRNVAEFARAVRRASDPAGAVVDDRLTALQQFERQRMQAAPTNYHEGGGSSGEGFMLPTQFRDEIWDLMLGMEDIFTTTDLEPTSARQVDYVADETTPWGSSGVQAYWRAEGEQMLASKQATEGRSLSLHEVYAFVLATEELLEDAPRLNARLSSKSAQALNWKINDAVIYGTGAGQPKGWHGSAAQVSVAKESGQAADTIVAQNVLKMFSRLLLVPGDNPYWLANRDTVPQLAAMTIGDQPVWIPPNGLISAPGGFLLGYPVRFSEHAKTLGDKGDIQLVSPKGYYAARRTQGVQFASSMHLYFDYNMQAFRWTFRFAGQPHLSAPISPANGASTKSHFVTLDERA